jgi:hypothetical protein
MNRIFSNKTWFSLTGMLAAALINMSLQSKLTSLGHLTFADNLIGLMVMLFGGICFLMLMD